MLQAQVENPIEITLSSVSKNVRRNRDYELGVNNPSKTPTSIYISPDKEIEQTYVVVNGTRGVLSSGIYNIKTKEIHEKALCQITRLRKSRAFVENLESKGFILLSDKTFKRDKPRNEYDNRITSYCLLWFGLKFSDYILKEVGYRETDRAKDLSYLERDINIRRFLPTFLMIIEGKKPKIKSKTIIPRSGSPPNLDDIEPEIYIPKQSIREKSQDFITLLTVDEEDRKIWEIDDYELKPLTLSSEDLERFLKDRNQKRKDTITTYLDDYSEEMMMFERRWLFENGFYNTASPTIERLLEYIKDNHQDLMKFDLLLEEEELPEICKNFEIVMKSIHSEKKNDMEEYSNKIINLENEMNRIIYELIEESLKPHRKKTKVEKTKEEPASFEQKKVTLSQKFRNAFKRKKKEEKKEIYEALQVDRSTELSSEEFQLYKEWLSGYYKSLPFSELVDLHEKELNTLNYDIIRRTIIYEPLVERYLTSGLLDTQTYEERITESIYIPLSISSEITRMILLEEHRLDLDRINKQIHERFEEANKEEKKELKAIYEMIQPLVGYNIDRISQGFVQCPTEEQCEEDFSLENCDIYRLRSKDNELL